MELAGPQGNRLSCRDQEGRRGSEEAVPGPSVFPSEEPGVSGSKEIPGLISFRIDWLDLLALQGTLKSLLQHELADQFQTSPNIQSSFLLSLPCKFTALDWSGPAHSSEPL